MPEISPHTDRVVQESRTALGLVNAADQNPVAKVDLQALFDSISHGGAIAPAVITILAAQIAAAAADYHITATQEAWTMLAGALVAGASYLWQLAVIKINKPKPGN